MDIVVRVAAGLDRWQTVNPVPAPLRETWIVPAECCPWRYHPVPVRHGRGRNPSQDVVRRPAHGIPGCD